MTTRHRGPTVKYDGARIAATPDAYVLGEPVVVEAKSVMSRNFSKWYTDPPKYYLMQVCTQLLVTQLAWGYIGALEEGDPDVSEFRFIVWKVSRSERIEQLMKEERLRKAIKFFRMFPNLSDKELYRKSVLKFCDLVEEYMGATPEEVKEGEEAAEELLGIPSVRDTVQEVFGDLIK
jgi:hypothetical protein